MSKADIGFVPIPKRRSRFINYTGQRFGSLVVLGYAGKRLIGPKKQPHNFWHVECDCGTLKIVRGSEMKSGKVVSCGCRERAQQLAIATMNLRHGHGRVGRKSATYGCWTNMLSRCNCPTNPAFDRYGGRGISVCERWQVYENFLADMGERPSRKHSLDRYPDNNGNYEPGNVRWATDVEQSHNKRNNKTLTHNGQTLCLSEWARRVGLNQQTLSARILAGWPAERALTTSAGSQ